ncbi:MAG: hypothetical protein NTU44_16745 [Bacteroidetes bacterium]|nr:hypothetical protein [Bacteroidota bacterium]
MRGGITFSNRWGWIGLIKDKVEWGVNHFGSNIFSGRTPSFAMIYLQLKPARWIELNYFHGWLISEVIDSSRSYYTPIGDYRAAYVPKYIAANLITVTPFRGISVSVGNSIVYSDIPVQPAYLIPVMFYKSIDHTINHGIDNQNSQMFATLSLRRIKHLHLYGNVFIDEFSIKRITDPYSYNFMSYKGGITLTDWPFRSFQAGTEYTISYPITYKHRVPSITFETNKYNLGHYMRDNSKDLWLWLILRPAPFLSVKVTYNRAIHYNEYPYLTGFSYAKSPAFKNKTWSREATQVKVNYEWSFNSNLFISYEISNIRGYAADGKTAEYYLTRYTSPLFQGNKNLLSAGINLGY